MWVHTENIRDAYPQRCAYYAFRRGNLCSKKQSNYAQIMLQILLFYASVICFEYSQIMLPNAVISSLKWN